MEKNVCGGDRLVRALLGLVLLGGLRRSRRGRDRTVSVREILAVYAVAELSVNVFAQWCPLNALFGVDTCRDD